MTMSFLHNRPLMVALIVLVGALSGCASLHRGYQPPGGGIWQAL